MTRLAEDLREKAPGDRLHASEINALIRAHRRTSWFDNGLEGEGFTATGAKHRAVSDWVQFSTTITVPPYSVFSLIAGEAWDEPVRFTAKQIGLAAGGSPLHLFTNGQTEIPANHQGNARPINSFTPTRLAYDQAGTDPLVGWPCGPKFESWEVGTDRFGLVCVAVDTTEHIVEVLRTADPQGVVGVVETEVTAFDPDTDTLGAGVLSIQGRTPSTDVLALQKDPATSATPWNIPVYSLRTTTIAVDEVVTADNIMGVGLVIPKSAAPQIPIELKTDLAKFGTATIYHLTDAGVRTATEETARDIVGYYEGVGSAGSGVDDEGDKGWCERLSDGELKFVALSCDPPGDLPT